MNTSLSRRTLLGSIAGLAAAPLVTSCSGAAGDSKLTDVKVGYIADGNGASTVAVADKLKLWDKHGLRAKTSVFTSGPLAIQALGTGNVDFAYIGPGALWLPMSGKAKVVALVSLGQADRVIAQPGTASLKDLAGKPVGVPEGTSGDMLLNLALEKEGMTMSDIKRVVMDPPTAISAFISGQIQGAAIWYPHVATVTARKPDLVELVKSTDFPELAFPSALVAGPDITQRADLLKRFQGVAKDANQWNHDHRTDAVDLLAGFLKAPKAGLESEAKFVKVLPTEELVAKSADGTIDGWLDTLGKLFTRIGKVKTPAPAKEFYLGAEFAKA
ncbi:aliphatic sulfonate ABC transporter substrate-binding protein [Kribbella sp. NPDC059898]|uniref:aliphatic sulfonate ABC transporter substrate-binding protein n=1 Tax=Kribbella sp. NPDC059898 TaxID=3346995 RepID=UPI003653140B